ncbi:MAG: MBL fold metallo-hydrolase [Myxococcota bacterium]
MKRGALIVGAVLVALGASLTLLWSALEPELPDGDLAPRGEIVPIVSGTVTSYLLTRASAPLVLVNPGSDPDATQILKHIEQLGRSPDDVRTIIVTHGSTDHAAGIEHFPRATVYASSSDLDLLDHVRRIQAPLPRLRMRIFGRPPRPPRLKTVLSSERLNVGGIVIEAVSLPGVTQGSMAYRFGDTLFVGDSLWQGQDGLEPPPRYWLESSDALDQALERVRTLPTEWIATSRHGLHQRGRTPITAGNGRRIEPVPASNTSVPEPY